MENLRFSSLMLSIMTEGGKYSANGTGFDLWRIWNFRLTFEGAFGVCRAQKEAGVWSPTLRTPREGSSSLCRCES